MSGLDAKFSKNFLPEGSDKVGIVWKIRSAGTISCFFGGKKFSFLNLFKMINFQLNGVCNINLLLGPNSPVGADLKSQIL
jgi:hypothetical protein